VLRCPPPDRPPAGAPPGQGASAVRCKSRRRQLESVVGAGAVLVRIHRRPKARLQHPSCCGAQCRHPERSAHQHRARFPAIIVWVEPARGSPMSVATACVAESSGNLWRKFSIEVSAATVGTSSGGASRAARLPAASWCPLRGPPDCFDGVMFPPGRGLAWAGYDTDLGSGRPAVRPTDEAGSRIYYIFTGSRQLPPNQPAQDQAQGRGQIWKRRSPPPATIFTSQSRLHAIERSAPQRKSFWRSTACHYLPRQQNLWVSGGSGNCPSH